MNHYQFKALKPILERIAVALERIASVVDAGTRSYPNDEHTGDRVQP